MPVHAGVVFTNIIFRIWLNQKRFRLADENKNPFYVSDMKHHSDMPTPKFELRWQR